jgi:hypothetical protein
MTLCGLIGEFHGHALPVPSVCDRVAARLANTDPDMATKRSPIVLGNRGKN